MAEFVLLDVEGVLRRPTLAAIDEGLVLYRGLSESSNVIPVVQGDHAEARRWLAAHRLPEAPYLLAQTDDLLEQVRGVLKLRVALRITASPERALEALQAGIPAMLLAVPELARPEFAPDYERPKRAWAALTGEVETQRRQAAEVLDEGPTPA